jgi:hypothetical protein
VRLRVRILITALMAALLTAAAAGAGAAGEPRLSVLGRDFRVSGPGATGNEFVPAVAFSATANEYLVVWEDYRSAEDFPFDNDIMGRRVSADGSPVGSDLRISGRSATVGELAPAVAWNLAANEYLVVWQDGRNSQQDIYGRRVSAGGFALGGDFRISGPTAAASDEWAPAVVWNGSANEYLVVWQDARNSATRGWDIYGQRVSASGASLGGNFRISALGATFDDTTPAVAWNGTADEYLVVWEDYRSFASRGVDAYGRRISAAGVPQGSDFRISGPDATSDDWTPAVAWNGSQNQYLVVWRDDRNSSIPDFEIYGRRISAAGVPLGANFEVGGPEATVGESDPDVVWNGATHEYLVAWQDFRNSPARGIDIYARRVSAAGTPLGSDLRISGNAAITDDGMPDVAWNSNSNQYLVVWKDGRNALSRDTDIFGRRLNG